MKRTSHNYSKDRSTENFLSSYQHNLLTDGERLAGFQEAIKRKTKGIVYDIGTGSGILSISAAKFADFIYALEINPATYKFAKNNLKSFKNVSVVNTDAKNFIFPEKADLIICEMLDTALIDEEQVPVVNSILKYLKKDGEVIPERILNGIEAIYMDAENICYEDIVHSPTNISSLAHEILSDLLIYSEVNFKKKIKEKVDVNLELEILKSGIMSGIKLTTFTIICENIICGPTPMLNPPLLIPTNKINVNEGDHVLITLKYEMGGGLNSVRTRVEKIS